MGVTRNWKLNGAAQIDAIQASRCDLAQIFRAHGLPADGLDRIQRALHVQCIPDHHPRSTKATENAGYLSSVKR